MKKIFTLMAGLFLSVALMAADHRPDLTIRNSRNYKIVIDGRSFYNNSSLLRINNLTRGMHRIQVFEMTRGGFFGQRERLVNSTSFRMGREDMRMFIDYGGRIEVRTDFNRNDRFSTRDREWSRIDRNTNYDWDSNDRYDNRNDGRIDDRRIDDRGQRNDDRTYDPRNNDRTYDPRNNDVKRDDQRRY